MSTTDMKLTSKPSTEPHLVSEEYDQRERYNDKDYFGDTGNRSAKGTLSMEEKKAPRRSMSAASVRARIINNVQY